ncbi:uncharacterized protein [Clytia hemisphaerica]|uniref:Uncharacterized protein n=1 Tax=Clytia hemisphaerica TaxID=252671 RepID=A0A7M5TYP2_9CNID|eukprot:TCONS_00048733-protein
MFNFLKKLALVVVFHHLPGIYLFLNEMPENNHGVEPLVVIEQEESIEFNKLKTTIPTLSGEWIVNIRFKMFGNEVSSTGYCNILHMTHDSNVATYGDRSPCIYYRIDGNLFSITSAVNGVITHSKYVDPVQFNTEYNVEIHQRYKSGGVYKYSILLNGEEIHSTDNTQAEQFHDVKVYTGSPWSKACNGTISQLKITNFL